MMRSLMKYEKDKTVCVDYATRYNTVVSNGKTYLIFYKEGCQLPIIYLYLFHQNCFSNVYNSQSQWVI